MVKPIKVELIICVLVTFQFLTIHGLDLGLVTTVLDETLEVVGLPLVGSSNLRDSSARRPDQNDRAIDVGIGEKKKHGGISGFLGFDEMLEPIIQLVRVPVGAQPVTQEPECTRSYFMGPYTKPVTFLANGTVGARKDRTCKWNFIGTEPCIPILTCHKFKLTRDSTSGRCKDSFEVRDGNVGLEYFCGTSGPQNISAFGGLRDLYVKYTAQRAESGSEIKLNCTVRCSDRGTGVPLQKSFVPILNSLCQCGRRPNTDLIVNGEKATKHEFPWVAALVKAKTRQPFCGASVINNRFLVTAAHCFKGDFLQVKNLEVLLGGHELDVTPNFAVLNASSRPPPRIYDPVTLQELDTGNGSVRFEIDEVMIHPLYVSNTNDFDVALIELSTPIDFAKYSQLSPICLPKLGSYLRTYAQRKAIVVGWGLGGAEARGTNAFLQKLNVMIYTPKLCKEVYAHRVSRRMLCAGYPDGGKDSCMGDSGGPLILEDTPHLWRQVGSVSWGEGCAESDNPGAYIRMTEVGQWIHHHSNLHQAEWCAIPDQARSKA